MPVTKEKNLISDDVWPPSTLQQMSVCDLTRVDLQGQSLAQLSKVWSNVHFNKSDFSCDCYLSDISLFYFVYFVLDVTLSHNLRFVTIMIYKFGWICDCTYRYVADTF